MLTDISVLIVTQTARMKADGETIRERA